jgi:PKD repeat protein
MKKLFTLLLISLCLFCTGSFAQPGTAACNANFTFSISGNEVHFYPAANYDSILVHHIWKFGDNSIADSSYNPTHQYSLPGVYNVIHTVIRLTPNNAAVCTATATQVVTIRPTPVYCDLKASFRFERDSLQPNKVRFYNTTSPVATNYFVKWNFGDGTYSSDYNATHVYTSSGLFRVCLAVRRDSLCTNDTCMQLQIQVPNTCNLVAAFTSRPDTANRLKIIFTNQSTPIASTDSISWTFGDGSHSADINPSHTYNQLGTYRVCLLIKKNANIAGATPCVKEICQTILVQQSCNLQASFTVTRDSIAGIANNVYHFTNTSTGTAANDSSYWSFGDGTAPVLNTSNPTHSYSLPGTYQVCLRIKRAVTIAGSIACVAEFCKTIIVPAVPAPCHISANFSWKADSLHLKKVYFSYTSITANPNAILTWNFGDGKEGLGANIVHEYLQPGSYTVCLKAVLSNTCFTDTCKVIVVRGDSIPPVTCLLEVRFTSKQDSANNRKIYFTNGSTPASSTAIANWSFGDGTNATGWNTMHEYREPGRYYVCLKVQAGPNCISYKCDSVTVAPTIAPCLLEVRFTSKQDSANNRKIYLTNGSTPASSTAIANWSFGDGTNATGWNTMHEYREPGRYYVCLKVQAGANCISYKCDSVTVVPTIAPCLLEVRFTSKQDSINSRKIYFTNGSTPASLTAIANWSFGDGTNANGWNTMHEYREPGRYYVCLKVQAGPNCISYKCDSVTITRPAINCDNISAGFVYRRDGYMPNKLLFFATSNTAVLHQRWTFKNLSNGTVETVTQNDPMHIFADTGTYYVCLRAELWGGCVKEHCDVIRIMRTNAVAQCMLQAYPNPAHNQVTVNAELTQPETIKAFIYSTQNILVREQFVQGTTGNNSVNINLQGLIPGFYSIRLVYGNKVCYSRFYKI